MNWINSLRRKPDDAGDKGTAAAAARAVADVGRLRAAHQGAVDDAQRAQSARDLGRALAETLVNPEAVDPAPVWVAAICHAPDKAIALAWLESLPGAPADEAQLAEVALGARFAEVRLAAAHRVEGSATLEHIAQQCRDKDRGVYRHCTDRLRTRHDAQVRDARAMAIGEQLRGLLAQAPVSVTHLLELERALRALGDLARLPAEPRELLAQVNARVLHEGEELRRAQALQASARTLSVQAGAAEWPGAEQFDALHGELAQLTAQRAGWSAWLAEHAVARATDAALAAAAAGLDAMAQEAERQRLQAAELEEKRLRDAQALAALPTAAQDSTPVDGKDAAGGDSVQGTRPEPGAPTVPAGKPRRKPAARMDPELVRGLVEDLEQAVDDGHLADADAIAARLKPAVGEGPGGKLEARVQRALARLADLHGWAKWGASRKREDLIAAAQDLLSGTHDVEHLATAIPALRQQWKSLDTQGVATRAQWEAFDTPLEKAYAPVAVLRAQEAARRAQARGAKEEFLARWEGTIAATDWESGDYTALDAQRQDAFAQWRALAMAGFRDERLLRKRFDAVIAAFDRHLAAARQAESARREALIAAAGALLEIGDLRRATTEAKALQERWRSPPGAPRLQHREEQKLWQRFRAACDAVFSRRDALRAEETARREQQAQARQAQLDAFAAVLEGSDTGAIKRALTEFRARWGQDGARGAASGDPLERRAQQLLRQAQQRVDALRQNAYREKLLALARSAPPATGPDEATRDSGREAREALLVDLEIALELPTPESGAELRRRRQIEKLQARFKAGAAGRVDPEQLLARFYATGAAPDAQTDQRVAKIIDRLVALQGSAGHAAR